MAERYESILDNERNAYQNELMRKNALFRQEYERLTSQLELQRESLIAQYEAKIEKMERAIG